MSLSIELSAETELDAFWPLLESSPSSQLKRRERPPHFENYSVGPGADAIIRKVSLKVYGNLNRNEYY